jgi:glycine/D-amino acid oxidase-like deaminating enzyme
VTPREVVIAGAGVTGLLAAVECALAGYHVTVLDRGPIPNPDASSADQHRALRTFAPGDPAATRRMAAAHRRWLELETLLGARFLRRVGVVTAWPDGEVDGVLEAAVNAGVPAATVAPEKLPHIGFPAGTTGVLELDAGVLLADRVLRTAARWLDAHPAVRLRPWSAVTEVDGDTGKVTLAGGEVLGADRVLVAAGPWTPELVGLEVVRHRQTMLYLRPPAELARWWETAPGAGRVGADARAWLLPPGDGTLLKISSDAVCREVPDTDCAGDSPADWTERLLAASILSDVDRYTVVAAKQCHYLTGEGDALLARVGPAVRARAACGGTGFATAPLAARRFVTTTTEETA